MRIPLSKRLKACADFVTPGHRIADIGCDHGYLSIYLLSNRIVSSVIAADINEMPLQSAVINAEKYGVQENIAFYLSDGAKSIPRDFDTLICAGMGADTMISILENSPWLCNSGYHLILQCQSKTPMLRRYLSDHGWQITRETVLRDGRFLYTVMAVSWDPEGPKLTDGQQYLSPALLQSGAPELVEFYNQICFRLKRAAAGQGKNTDPEITEALKELENDPAFQHLKEQTI